jgi:molybdate transport system substrate-binding protein
MTKASAIILVSFHYNGITSTSMKSKSSFLLIALVCICAWMAAPARAGEIKVAAAADLTFAFQDAAAKFQKETSNTVRLSYGSSGNFFSQIKNGAPYDIFFSADVDYPKKLEAEGLAEPGSLYEYAAGKIVIWVAVNSKLAIDHGLPILLEPGIHKIAIANPQHAPYGRAALAALRHSGIYDRIKSKLVLGENISQTAQFVESGNADVGILALSLAVAPAMKARGLYFEIPSDEYPPIIQGAVILKAAHHKDAAQQFLNFLKQPAGVALMESYGFALPREVAGTAARSGAPD